MDKYETMRIFIRVAELQSFTQAAETLNLPRATVSVSVQNLEAWVGTRLLNRTTRRVQLTNDGISFLERCKYLLGDLEEAESMFRRDATQLKGKIRVDMVATMAKVLFIPMLPRFLEKHPGIEIEISSTDGRVDLVRAGIDCMVKGGKDFDRGLAKRELGEAAIVNCASPKYLAKYGKPKNIEDLKNHRLIHFAPVLGSKPEGFEFFDGEKYQEIGMPGIVTVNNTETYTAACLAGFGISQNPLGVVAKHLKSGALVEVLPKFKAEPMKISLVYPHQRLMPKRVRAFMDWLEAAFKEIIG